MTRALLSVNMNFNAVSLAKIAMERGNHKERETEGETCSWVLYKLKWSRHCDCVLADFLNFLILNGFISKNLRYWVMLSFKRCISKKKNESH